MRSTTAERWQSSPFESLCEELCNGQSVSILRIAVNSNPIGNSERIAVECPCGKRLSASSQHVGKRVKCPSCGQAIVIAVTPVPPTISASPSTTSASSSTTDDSKTKKPTIVLVLSLTAALISIGGVLFLAWRSIAVHEAKTAEANGRVSQAVTTAREWMDGKSEIDFETIDKQLQNAINGEYATQKSNGQSVLEQIRAKHTQEVEGARIARLRKEAEELFDKAKQEIDAKRVQEALDLLRKYLDDPNATEKSDAQELYAEAHITVSDNFTIDSLIAMTEDDFRRAETAEAIDDGKVKTPVLLGVRAETIRKNLEKAKAHRETKRLAELDRKAKAPLEVFLGGILTGDNAAFCRRPMKFEEVVKPKKKSEFDEIPSWESSFKLSNVKLADGVSMDISIVNTGGQVQQTAWAWSINATDPARGVPSDYCRLDLSIDGKIEKYSFDPAINFKLITHMYNFPSESRSVRARGVPLQPIFKEIAYAKKVRYQLTIGSKKIEAELPAEVQDGLKQLLKEAAYEDRQSQLNRMLNGR